jgi:parallel beta-helix repeat protein
VQKLVSRVILFLLITSVLASAFETRTARADGTVYINADGSITPASAPISTLDNVTYTLTGNVNESIVVQRSNIVLDGAGHRVQGSGSGNGIDLESVNNVTVENASVNDFRSGIWLNSSFNDTLVDNSLTWNGPYGIYLNVSSNDRLSDNYASGSRVAIYLYTSSNNTLSGNTAIRNDQGIILDSSSNNTLNDNDVTENPAYGIGLYSSSYNLLSDNTLLGNAGLGGVGIYLTSSSYNTLSRNNATANYDGIVLDSSPNNALFQNVFDNNVGNNFVVYGSALSDYLNWIDASNLVNVKPVYYIVDQDGLVIDPATHPSVGYLAIVNCTNVTVENLTLTNKNWQGALLAYTRNSTVTKNNVATNEYGIYLYSSCNNTVSDNNLTGTTEWGIYIDSSFNNTVSDNDVVQNIGGISLSNDSNNTVSGNNVTGNHGGIGLGPNSSNDTVSGNIVTGSTSWGIWLLHSWGNTVSGNNVTRNNYDGIILYSSFNDTVSGNNATGNFGDGIYVFYHCFNETVTDNNVSENTADAIGIGLSSNNNTVSDNNVTANSEGGIALYSSSGNTVSGNNAIGNADGVSLDNSSSNAIYHNNFMNNTQQAALSSSGPNTLDEGYLSGGNYWSDYNGTDVYSGSYQNVTGSDGVGDAPYVIDSNNTDNYPLMKPYVGEVRKSLVTPLKTVAARGCTLNISLFIMNYGSYREVFNATVYANTNVIGTVANVTLAGRNSIILTFAWNTSGLAYGNYTISAYATPVPGETDTTDNNRTSTVYVGIPGDVNGDGTVNVLDVKMLGKTFLATPGSSNWNSNADINGDGVVNILDAIILANHFLQHYP